MKVDKKSIYWAYKILLGREPESKKAVKDLLAQIENTSDLLRIFTASKEFLDRNPEFVPQQYIRHKPPLSIEVNTNVENLKKLFSRVESSWENIGSTEPHWSVMASDEFRTNKISETIDDFYQSGKYDSDIINATFKRNGFPIQGIETCTEIGCGVGRITRWLSSKFKKVTAVDISAPHLTTAKEYLTCQGIRNVDFKRIARIEESVQLPLCDLLFTVIVLQHNPPPVMVYLIDKLLSRINPGGFAIFQLPTYLDDYTFETNSYLQTTYPPETLEVHVLPQKYVFEIARKNSCEIIEVAEDFCIGRPPGGVSNTFFLRKLD